MKIRNTRQQVDGYGRLLVLAILASVLAGWIAMPVIAQSQADQTLSLRRQTLVYPTPAQRRAAELNGQPYGVYGYDGAAPAEPLPSTPVERSMDSLGIEDRGFPTPLADPRISPGTEPHYGYLHGYDYDYRLGSGTRDNYSYQFSFRDGTTGPQIVSGEKPSFRARYMPGAYNDNAGFYGYRGAPDVYGFYEPAEFYRPIPGRPDVYGYYGGNDLQTEDLRPMVTPEAYQPPRYYLNDPAMSEEDRRAFAARWPRALRLQEEPLPQLMPRERETMREQDLARLQNYQERPPLAYRENPNWQQVDNYAHQWSDPRARQRRETFAAANGQNNGGVYGYGPYPSQDEAWRDQERLQVMREREERERQLLDAQTQGGVYGYGEYGTGTDRAPAAAGGRADDRRYWGRGDTRYWGPPEGRYWDYEGRRWWYDEDAPRNNVPQAIDPQRTLPDSMRNGNRSTNGAAGRSGTTGSTDSDTGRTGGANGGGAATGGRQ